MFSHLSSIASDIGVHISIRNDPCAILCLLKLNDLNVAFKQHLIKYNRPNSRLVVSDNGMSAFLCSLGSILEGPLLGLGDGTILILFPVISNFLIKWIIQVWKRHQSLDGEENGSNLESWRPLVLQNIKANSTQLIDIWVIDLGSEEDLWWNHWVLIWQEELAIKETSLIWSLGWASDLDVEMSIIFLIWLSVDSNN